MSGCQGATCPPRHSRHPPISQSSLILPRRLTRLKSTLTLTLAQPASKLVDRPEKMAHTHAHVHAHGQEQKTKIEYVLFDMDGLLMYAPQSSLSYFTSLFCFFFVSFFILKKELEVPSGAPHVDRYGWWQAVNQATFHFHLRLLASWFLAF